MQQNTSERTRRSAHKKKGRPAFADRPFFIRVSDGTPEQLWSQQ
ncbi:hypothetical protein ACFVYR_21345 [Streptomyces sp. NPDC058284]